MRAKLNNLTDLSSREPANANIQAHIASAHAPSNAQKNSDITKAEIEAKLIGEITTHTHAAMGGGKKYQAFQFHPASATTVTADQKNMTQSRFNSVSIFGALGLTTGAGVPETAGAIDLNYLSDVGVPNITPNYISKVKKVTLSYSRNASESGANTNITIRVMSDSRYFVDTQLICQFNLISTTSLSNQEAKIDIPILTHLNLSAFSNLKWCVRSNNATAQTFNILRLNIDIEEV